MEALEDLLRKVGDLRRDLSAEIPEEGHYESYPIIEEVSGGGFAGASSNIGRVETGEFEERWLVDKSAEPDEQKREAARAELQRVYDSSEWYSARYVALQTLDTDLDQLAKQVDLYMEELEKAFSEVLPPHHEGAPRPTGPDIQDYRCSDATLRIGHHDRESRDARAECPECERLLEDYERDRTDWKRNVQEWEASDKKRLVTDAPDYEKREKAKRDLWKLYKICKFSAPRMRMGDLLGISEADILANELSRGEDLTNPQLSKVYNSASEAMHRKSAGRKLRYSSLRIWFHELKR